MKNLYFIKIVFVILLCLTLSVCSNRKEMSNKKNIPAEEQPIAPQTEGTSGPTRQASPMSLPLDTTAKTPADQNKSVPIGMPVSAEEMERLKKESAKPTPKKPKPKAPDN
jgi:hypothetical protein